MDNALVNGGREWGLNNTTASSPAKGILALFSLKGKTAIIAGAAAGIGLEVAKAYAEAGADVALWYHSNKAAIERAAEIEKKYGVKCRSTLSSYHPILSGTAG
jgi:sorbose reductase